MSFIKRNANKMQVQSSDSLLGGGGVEENLGYHDQAYDTNTTIEKSCFKNVLEYSFILWKS